MRRRAQDLSDQQDRGNLDRTGENFRQDSFPSGAQTLQQLLSLGSVTKDIPVGSLKLPEDKLKAIMPLGIDVARGSMLNVQDILGNYSLTDYSNFQNSILIFCRPPRSRESHRERFHRQIEL